jgi:hypothetical protein
MKYFMAFLVALLPVVALGATLTVSLDGSQQYTSIQTAVNAAVTGDVVLVHPGRYMENLDLSDTNGITLASMEYITGDSTYVNTTIIDGSTNSTSTILCYENTVNCMIRGFSITGGRGYDYQHGQSPHQIFGGGIFISNNNSLILSNLNIYGNRAASGGGITILDRNTVHLSKVNIYNNIARWLGGGLVIGSSPTYGSPEIIFAQTYRCSIYNNFAQWGMDIHWQYTHGGTVSVYLKRFTVPQWERYFGGYYDALDPSNPYTVFDIQEGWLEPVQSDLYVSPGGDDGNDGLSPASALKTPSLAMQRIASDPNNPLTVHLLEGYHHNVIMGEYLPIVIKDHCRLVGMGEGQTRLCGTDMLRGTGVVSAGMECSDIALRELSISTSMASAYFSWGVNGGLIENITIEDSTVDRWLFVIGFPYSTLIFRNVTMQNNLALTSTFGIQMQCDTVEIDNMTMRNNQTQSLPPSIFDQNAGALDIYYAHSVEIRNSRFLNNVHRSVDGWANFRFWNTRTVDHARVALDNCLFASNSAIGGVRQFDFFQGDELRLTNCTIANNICSYTDNILNGFDEAYFINSLFYNNGTSYEIRTTANTFIDNCLFDRDNNIWRTYDSEPLQWGPSNITGADPLFVGGIPQEPDYYRLFADDANGYSPAIDAGSTDPGILPVGYVFPVYDLYGNARIYGSSVDIGSYESPGYTGIQDEVSAPAGTISLDNFPNPFNPSTTVSYSLPKASDAQLTVYNLKGQLVRTLADEYKAAGEHHVVWDGRDNNSKQVSSGVYFIRLKAEGNFLTHKVLMLK